MCIHRGVDFGLDGVTGTRDDEPDNILFTTEILFRKAPTFTDGDILRLGGTIVIPDTGLISAFEPKADFLGVDAFFQADDSQTNTAPPEVPPSSPSEHETFLPVVTKPLNK